LAIRGEYGGTPTRPPELGNHHEAGPWVLDLLKEHGVNLLATSNNHAYDLANEGMMSTLEELARHNFSYAGSGLNITDALRSTQITTKHGAKVGLVGVVSAPTLYTYGGIATDTQMGVNAMQMEPLAPGTYSYTPISAARAAQVAAHLAAAPQNDILISYHHNHYFQPLPGGGTDEMFISDWWSSWAKTAIDSGADIYVSHGSTVLHGVDFYKGKPILYGLGSTWFHTRKPDGSYKSDSWESVIADLCVDEKTGETTSMRFIPIVLTNSGPGIVNSTEWMTGRGVPSVAQNARGIEILHHLKNESNVNIIIDEDKFEAYVKFPIEPVIHEHRSSRPLTETNDLDGERYE